VVANREHDSGGHRGDREHTAERERRNEATALLRRAGPRSRSGEASTASTSCCWLPEPRIARRQFPSPCGRRSTQGHRIEGFHAERHWPSAAERGDALRDLRYAAKAQRDVALQATTDGLIELGRNLWPSFGERRHWIVHDCGYLLAESFTHEWR
jgi:hypothetical protein